MLPEVTTRMGDETHSQPSDHPSEIDDEGHHHEGKSKLPKFVEPDSDDERNPNTLFDVNKAWEILFALPSCQKVMILEHNQRRLKLMVGVNVSQEFPWKQIRYKDLQDFLFDEIDNGHLVRSMGFLPDHQILVGYAPLLTQNQDDIPEGDPFVIYLNPDDAKTALSVIRNIELFERWQMNKRLIKKPRRWVSLGSEDEILLTLQQRYVEPVDVEIQSVYPMTIPANKEFSLRKAADVRDGYIQLVPGEAKFDNINRRRVTVGIQSAPMVIDAHQQTDPTFPTNAWAQYFYELAEDEGLDESSDEEAHKEAAPPSPRKTSTPEPERLPKPPPEMSEQIKLLLDTLEFNQIDMYRDDYAMICDKKIEHYTNPYLEETLCFANISKSNERYVCGIDWYPSLSGLIVTSYTFSTPSTIESISVKVDAVQRAVLQPNPILMWSFNDNLNSKLEFESPQEVTTLSFCPYDANLLFGGSKNGQIIIWDLQNRAEKLDYEEILTTAQSKYRILIGDFLKWTILIDEESIVPPATISGLEHSQKAAITGIYWMSNHFFINSFGKIYSDPSRKANHKFFITCAIDGTITFWNLDDLSEKKGASAAAAARRDEPKALNADVSRLKNKSLTPVFTVAFNEPITGIVADTSVFNCLVLEHRKARKNPLNYRIRLDAKDRKDMRTFMITSSFYGRIERLVWLGLYSDADTRENATVSLSFARVHDGPVVAMKKNPFIPNIFISIGRNVFAVWKEDYHYSPIFWRKCDSDLTMVSWSESRPAVFFLTRIDGNLEAWDVLSRDDSACYNDIIGGGIITAISEHRPVEPEKLIGIGDYNSSFRMMKLPLMFYVMEPHEEERFKEYIAKEQERKVAIQEWEHLYYENNKDVIEAKRQAEIDARKEMERIEKENLLKEARKLKEEADERNQVRGQQLPYTERMRRKWDELNLNRLLSILMSRKRVNAEQLEKQTMLEKRYLAYEAAKVESHHRVVARIPEEVAAIRARILPAEKVDLQRMDMIEADVRTLMETVESYENIEEAAAETVNVFDAVDTVEYIDFLHQGAVRRKLLNKALGGNTDRTHWYEFVKENQRMNECDWGFETFVAADDGTLLFKDEDDMYRPKSFREASSTIEPPEQPSTMIDTAAEETIKEISTYAPVGPTVPTETVTAPEHSRRTVSIREVPPKAY